LFFDSFAKPSDMDVDRTRAHVMLLAPDLLEQLLTVIGAAGMSEKKFEQTKFGGGEGQLLVAQGEPMGRAVEREGAEPQQSGGGNIGFVLIAAAQVSFDPGHHLARAERLGDIIVAAYFETEHPVYLIGPCGQEEDR